MKKVFAVIAILFLGLTFSCNQATPEVTLEADTLCVDTTVVDTTAVLPAITTVDSTVVK
jgi:hypothetical protein